MTANNQVQISQVEKSEQWNNIYMLGFITTLIVIFLTVADIIVGTMLGGDLSLIPKTAVERFAQFQSNWLLGLYNLDMLNLVAAIIMIPTYFALYTAHRRVTNGCIKLSLVIFAVGTAVFISNNAALPMLELSRNYASAATEGQRYLLAAAGEAMLARGTHGSPGAFLGFVLSTIASIVLSIGMLKGKIFSKTTAYLGISGGVLLLAYLVSVTFVPNVKNMAMLFSAPGGLLSLAWIIMFAIKLFKLGHHPDIEESK